LQFKKGEAENPSLYNIMKKTRVDRITWTFIYIFIHRLGTEENMHANKEQEK